ncbi:RNA polymerase recycling motor HelD [Kurthia senegalensis]|uniref:RNA polymerase recycling motor HelD n=1 Tax=Kurthia senegalensis TaxID=1033740 RepID=UPI000288CDCF|nr:RNA polymerase recycling motor HelD [Kurthia senegalensis]
MQHPEFEQEQQHLAYVKHFMANVLKESAQDLVNAQDNIRKSMADLEYLDSSSSYLNILTNSRFFDMAREQKEGLEAIIQKPYFARIHFQKDGEFAEKLYIGKTSLFDRETQDPVIVDWRSPVANVYYDGRLGDLTYDVNGEEMNGHLFAKRQYKIEKGKLLSVRDVDLTTNDELLQDALSGKADVRLTEIVSTIQAEQNEIIRAHLKQPIIVQGAAGSGKTTIALHRISYFLYTMGEHFNADQLMILAPNHLFIDYIGDVLPELGVGKIRQETFASYVMQATKLKLKIQDPNVYLEQLVQAQASEKDLVTTRLKGSMEYRDIMQNYVDQIARDIAVQFEDVYIDKYRIMRASHLQELFLEDYVYLPIEERIQKLKSVIQSHVRQKRKQIVYTLNKKYDDIIGKALNIFNDERRKKEVTRWIDERDERIPAIEKEAKSTASNYMKRFSKYNIKKLYRAFLTEDAVQQQIAPQWTKKQRISFQKEHAKEQWTNEDLAALFFLHAKIKGIKPEHKIRVVFIDEVQDYSLFQLAALKEGLDTDMFTIVGDLAQGIHSYRSLTNWEDVQALFPRASYKTLQKSYRTTIEIMAVANEILSQMDEDLPLVEPVVRHGLQPAFHEETTWNTETIVTLFNDIKQRHQSIALICKTSAEAKKIAASLTNVLDVQLLDGAQGIDQEKLLIVPSHLAKGLEFDAVMIVSSEEGYRDVPLERKLLYVAMTRSMHELHLIGPSKQHFLLQ